MDIDTALKTEQIDNTIRLHRKTASNAIKRLFLASTPLVTEATKMNTESTLSVSPTQANQFHRKAATYAIFGDLFYIV